MICPECYSVSKIPPCETCGGYGILHCCDGERPDLAFTFDAYKLKQTDEYFEVCPIS